MAKGTVDFINKLPYVKHKTGDITHWTPVHFTEDSPTMVKDQEIEFEVKEGMAYRVIKYKSAHDFRGIDSNYPEIKRGFTAKEIGEKLFKIHHHEQTDNKENDSNDTNKIFYYEEDIIQLLQELGHPAPDWNWYKEQKPKKICPNKDENGSCPLHNLHCQFPDCEK